jgi:hypothetical protein
MENVGFGLTGSAWNGGSGFWPDWNGLEWRKFVSAGLECFWNGRSRFGPDWNGLARQKSIVCPTEMVCKNERNSKRD